MDQPVRTNDPSQVGMVQKTENPQIPSAEVQETEDSSIRADGGIHQAPPVRCDYIPGGVAAIFLSMSA